MRIEELEKQAKELMEVELMEVDGVLEGGNIRMAGAVPIADYEKLLRVARHYKRLAKQREANISLQELDRLHDAAKIIEYDAAQAYHTCCERFGREIANALLVAFFRRNVMQGALGVYPEPEDLREKVNKILQDEGIL